jgi:hypothetical protein
VCYRFRMNFGTSGEDFASEVWNAGFVGIWHGSWVPEDLYSASDSCRRAHGYVTPKALARALSDVMASKGSSSEIKREDAGAGLRFDELEVGTWVFTFFDRSIHMAQIAANDPVVLRQFEHNGETFKAKPIKNQKAFRLDELPPSFLLLPSAGRVSVHKVPSCTTLLNLLVDHKSPAEVASAFDSLPWDVWITALGPKGWESLCLGYLIQERGFLPTGLSVGGTLADFDIVGRLRSGELAYAQCKADLRRHTITPDEEKVFASVPDAKKFFFARSGVSRDLVGVTHLDQTRITEWLTQSKAGIEYLRLLRPNMPPEDFLGI